MQCCTTTGCNWDWMSAVENVGAGEGSSKLTVSNSSETSETLVIGLIGKLTIPLTLEFD